MRSKHLKSGEFTELFKKERLRNTKHRSAILGVLATAKKPLTADEIYLKLTEGGISVNLSTVYRTLEVLSAKNIVSKSTLNDQNKAYYVLSPDDHHHYLFCTGCNRLISVTDCPLKEFEKTLHEKLGFNVTSHKLEVYGLCQDCRQKER